MRRRLRTLWQDRPARAAAVAALALLGTTLFAQTGLFDRLRWWAYDWQQTEFAATIDLDPVAVVDIDDSSLDALEEHLGPWPYDRDVYARVNTFLKASGAKAVGYHLTLTESRSGDDALAASLSNSTVIGAMALPVPTFEGAAPGERLARGSLRALGATERWPHHEWRAIRLPAATIDPGRPGRIGVVNHHPDEDGTVRRLGVLHGWGPHVLPSLPLATLLASTGFGPIAFERGRLRFTGIDVPLNDRGEALMRFPAQARGLNVIAFHTLLAATETPNAASGTVADAVRGRLVLIGRLLPPAGDYLHTPIGPMSGLELTALGLAAVKGGHVLVPARWWIDLPLLAAALVLPVLLVLRGTRATPREFLGALGTLTVLLLAAGMVLFAMGQDSAWVFAITAGWMATALAAGAWFATAYDERRQLELETRAASEANRLKTEFLNHLTHELRTPLTAIMGFNKINQLTDDLGKGARIKNSEVIGRNCQHLLALINNHLDLAKIAAGTLSLAPTPEDPEKLCRDAIDSLRSLADEKRLRLRFVKRTPLPSAILLDASRVRQILINLIGNALKFTQSGTVELVAAWHVAVLQLEIRDTGPGIPQGALERIFEPFEQADATVAARFGGTGLGLTIARKLVDLMQGAIEVESEVGVGTVFRVRLPTESVARAAEPSREPASLAAAREPLAGRVLVAEDNEDIRALVQLQLRRLGVDVTMVSDGFAAVDAAMTDRYDVVLMDLEMPIMNGFEAVNVLRTRGYSGTIFALTAYHSGAEAERALSSGCDALVTKPTSVESLRRSLAPVLPELPRKQLSSR
jgi:signal transduction histidine kinase/ActR/RegA family two-component response regulator